LSVNSVTAVMAAASQGQTFIVQCLGFAVLVLVIVKLALPQLGKILGSRSREIEETFKKIEQDTQETSKRVAEIKEKVAHLAEESKRRLDEAMADALKTKAQVTTESTSQVQAAFTKANAEIEIEREKAVLEIRNKVTALTLGAAEVVVQSAMSDPIHEHLVEEYLTQLDAVKKT
jgi:F-type H+-transporting ATPase subunit b